VRRHPELARALLAHGHRIENHTQHHPLNFSCLGPRRMRAEIAAAQDTVAQATGSMPRFFRAPAGLRNPFLQPLLEELGLQLASWTRRGFDTVTGDPGNVLRRLTRSLRAGDILLMHDGHSARTTDGRAVIIDTLPRVLDVLQAMALRPVTLGAAMTGDGP
jgi:peptidoglycan/xylan/chitin deacetylase (PgdA/CDA1 family)